jgi:hypothetical protein
MALSDVLIGNDPRTNGAAFLRWRWAGERDAAPKACTVPLCCGDVGRPANPSHVYRLGFSGCLHGRNPYHGRFALGRLRAVAFHGGTLLRTSIVDLPASAFRSQLKKRRRVFAAVEGSRGPLGSPMPAKTFPLLGVTSTFRAIALASHLK